MMPPGVICAPPIREASRIGARLAVPLDEVEVLDDDATLTRARLDDAALLAAVLAGEHLHGSPFLIFIALLPSLENLGSQADDLHEVLLAQLAGDRPEDARARAG